MRCGVRRGNTQLARVARQAHAFYSAALRALVHAPAKAPTEADKATARRLLAWLRTQTIVPASAASTALVKAAGELVGSAAGDSESTRCAVCREHIRFVDAGRGGEGGGGGVGWEGDAFHRAAVLLDRVACYGVITDGAEAGRPGVDQHVHSQPPLLYVSSGGGGDPAPLSR